MGPIRDVAHKSGWQTFEVVFGIPFVLAVALHLVVPLPFPRAFLGTVLVAAGIALFIAGTAFVALARRELAHHGQPTDPGHPTSRLVTSGVFSVSRNPLCLGGAFILAGIALVMKATWGLVLLIPALSACHCVLIAPEERYLAGKFGIEYSTYITCVRRWLGRGRGTI